MVVSPAPLVAVQLTVWTPTVLVSSASQDWETTPDTVSVASGVTWASPLSRTGFGSISAPMFGPGISRVSIRLLRPRVGIPA